MTRPMGQLERSLAALTIGVAQGERQRRLALADTHTGEYMQQVHVPLSGVATGGWGSIDVPVTWELPFLYAPLQRRVPFPTPHFHANFEVTAGQGALLLMHAQLIAWNVTDADWYVGATIRFAIAAPGGQNPNPQIAYSAIAHCSFQGFATLPEGDEFTK